MAEETKPPSPPPASVPPPAPKAAPTGSAVPPQTAARTAPAIKTEKSESPYKIKIKALEDQLASAEESKTRAGLHARAVINTQLAALKDQEARQFQGGNIRTPRANLLMEGAAQAENPDHHLRWVNESIPGRADLLRGLGYERIPGQRGLGELALYRIPRDKWAEGEVTKQEETDRKLRAATGADRDAAVQELQTYFDKAGVKIDVERHLFSGR